MQLIPFFSNPNTRVNYTRVFDIKKETKEQREQRKKPVERGLDLDEKGNLKEDLNSRMAASRGKSRAETKRDQEKRSLLEEASIDSFLRGEYDCPFSEDSPAPHPGFSPSQTIDAALRSLRALDDPYPSHGAAVFGGFVSPLLRSERWGTYTKQNDENYSWKEVLRGALTPMMLAQRLRGSSDFSILLD